METSNESYCLETRLIHGIAAPKNENGATITPIYYSTAFEHDSAESMERIFQGKEDGFVYTRLRNPTVAALESRFAAVCNARGVVAAASGMSAIALALLALLKSGDELIAGRFLHGSVYTLFDKSFRELGITVHFIDPRHPEEAAARFNDRTRAVFLEALANPAMVVPDIRAFSRLCREHGVPLIADATLLTPCAFDAAALGVSISVYSASKFLAGPATTLGGLIVDNGTYSWRDNPPPGWADLVKQHGESAFLAKLSKRMMMDYGPALAPMNAFLLLLGLETLSLRMERQNQTAERIAEFLNRHPIVREVLYAGLPGAPGHELAKAQFGGRFGSLIAFTLASRAACFSFLNALRLIRRSSNLGDTKSLAIHPASTLYAGYWPAELAAVGVGEEMIRLSVGLEAETDIISDLAQALATVARG